MSAWFSFFTMQVSVFLAPVLPASTSASVWASRITRIQRLSGSWFSGRRWS